jgi:hypothetical protein
LNIRPQKTSFLIGGLILLYLLASLAFDRHIDIQVEPDTGQYERVASWSLTSSDFWMDWRPHTTPLIFKLFGNNHNQIAAFQFAFGKFAWILLALSAAANLRKNALKVIGCAAILILSLGTDFALAYKMMLTEGIAYSLTVFVLASWLLAIAYFRDHPTAGWRTQLAIGVALLAGLGFWAASRHVHAYLLILVGGLLGAVLVLRWRQLRLWRPVLIFVILGSALIYLFISIPVGRSDYWKQAQMNFMAEKVLPYPEKREFFVERGMRDDPEALIFSGYVPARYAGDWTPIYSDWLSERGRSAFYLYLLWNPPARWREVPSNAEIIFNPDVMLWVFNRRSAEGDFNRWQSDIDYFYYDPGALMFFIAGGLGLILCGLLPYRDRQLSAPIGIAFATLALMLPLAYLTWYGDAYYERVFMGISLLTKVGVVLLALFASDQALSKPNSLNWKRTAFVLMIGMTACGIIELMGGVGFLRKEITYPLATLIAPDQNLLRPWDISDTEYQAFQEAEIGEAVLNLQQEVVNGTVYYREYLTYWRDGASGELHRNAPNEPLELQWRNTPAPYSEVSPDGPVFGGFPLDSQADAAFTQWESTRLPGNLRDVGIQTLVVDGEAWATLPEFQAGVLHNPELFEQVKTWEQDSVTQTLYRVVGNAHNWNDLAEPLPPEIQTRYESRGESSDLVPSDAVIFNPTTGTTASQSLQINLLSNVIQFSQPAGAALDSIFDLMQTVEHSSYELDLPPSEAITEWRTSKDPGLLQEAGIDYLLVDDVWLSWLTSEEQALFSDGSKYELAQTWQGIVPGGYFLYKIRN